MPIKNAEIKYGELYIKNPDSDDLIKLGPVQEFQATEVNDEDTTNDSIPTFLNKEFTFTATMTYPEWLVNWIKTEHNNNYRKLHGLPMKRRRQIMKARMKRYKSIIGRYYGSVRVGNYVWARGRKKSMMLSYVGEKE